MNNISLNSRSACLASGVAVNLLDHLVVVAYILGIPVITDEETSYDFLKNYYPQVNSLYISKDQNLLKFLSDKYSSLFVSYTNYRRDLFPLFEILFKKKMKFWYCPHGNSDKPMDQFKIQDYSLVYGKQMIDRLKALGILPNLLSFVTTGNYRLSFYKKYALFYDNLVNKKVFSQFKKNQTTILYAPTWQDREHSSSLFDVGISIVDQLPEQYNLIIKLHPRLEQYYPGHVHLIKEKYKHKPNISVLCLFPVIFPLLEKTDIYLGDFSFGYDFLYYNRPLFYFDPIKRINARQESSELHSCGLVIPKSSYTNIFGFIEKNLEYQSDLKEKRQKYYNYAFGKSKSFEDLKREIYLKLLS